MPITGGSVTETDRHCVGASAVGGEVVVVLGSREAIRVANPCENRIVTWPDRLVSIIVAPTVLGTNSSGLLNER
jgi:hypothetical protein